MATASSPVGRSSYWELSRTPRYSVLFALPLLALYELMAAAMNRGGSGIRNGADVLLKSVFVSFLGPRGPVIFGILLVAVMIALVVRDVRRHPGRLRGWVFGGMVGESVVLALTGIAAGVAATLALGRLARGLLFQITPADPVSIAAAATLMFIVACMAGLGPAIHPLTKRMDARVKPAHDEKQRQSVLTFSAIEYIPNYIA